MSEAGKSNLGATATIIVAVIGLLTTIVSIVPKLLETVPKEKIENTSNVGGAGQQQLTPVTPQGQGGQQGGGFVPNNSTDAEKEALKQKQADLERQMEQMKKDLEAQKKRGNASSGSSTSSGEDDIYYKPIKISGRWNVAGYPGMQYVFSINGSSVTFTMMNNGVNTGSGQGYINGNMIQFEAMDMQSTYTGSLEISPDGRQMTGVAYNAYGQYFPMTLSK